MNKKVRNTAAALLALGIATAVGSTAAQAAEPGCVYSGGGWICYGMLPPEKPPVVAPEAPAPPAGQYAVSAATRVAGDDRFATAAAISARAYPDGHGTVYLANGYTLVDALAAGAVADGPILLVTATSIPAATAAELDRLAPQNVIILGGPSSVSDDVAAQAAAIAAP